MAHICLHDFGKTHSISGCFFIFLLLTINGCHTCLLSTLPCRANIYFIETTHLWPHSWLDLHEELKESSTRFSCNHEKTTIYWWCQWTSDVNQIHVLNYWQMCFCWSHLKRLLIFIIFFHHEPGECSRDSVLLLSSYFLSFCPPSVN